MQLRYLFIAGIIAGLSILACNPEDLEKGSAFRIREIPLNPGLSGESNLFVNSEGEVFLTWVSYMNDSTDAFVFSNLKNETWSNPDTIATGQNWFVNWADFPSVSGYKDHGNSFAAHWLVMRDTGTYDYDIHIAQSIDKGKTWGKTFIPHKDSLSAEHGFVTMVPDGPDHIFATWLDGRNTKSKEGSHHGAMSLRAGIFDREGNMSDEAVLDSRVCDCCQTDAVITPSGAVVVYRDRSENEIRDIAIVRNIDRTWMQPQTIFQDNWIIAGCPVNGPAIDASDNLLAISWYTVQDETPKVMVIFSRDHGATFGKAFQIDDGNPLGRVDIILHNGNAIVSWIEKAGKDAEVRLAIVGENGKSGQSKIITPISSARNSGFPILARSKERFFISWTHVGTDIQEIKTAEIFF